MGGRVETTGAGGGKKKGKSTVAGAAVGRGVVGAGNGMGTTSGGRLGIDT